MANNNKFFLAENLHLSFVSKTGQAVPKDRANKNVPLNEKVYLIQSNANLEQEANSTSQKPEFNVLYANDIQTGEMMFSADKVKQYYELKMQGKLPSNISLEEATLENYINISLDKEQNRKFEEAIISNGNEDLGTVMRLLIEAYESNNHVALGKMIESMKGRENFEFLFEGGRLDFNKMKDMIRLSNSVIEKGFDLIEFLEERYGIINSLDATAHSLSYAATKGIPDHIMAKIMEVKGVDLQTESEREGQELPQEDKVAQEQDETELDVPELEVSATEVTQEKEGMLGKMFNAVVAVMARSKNEEVPEQEQPEEPEMGETEKEGTIRNTMGQYDLTKDKELMMRLKKAAANTEKQKEDDPQRNINNKENVEFDGP